MAAYGQPISTACGTPRVLAVDDQRPFLVVMRRVVDATPGFQFMAEADSGERALATARELKPDMVLMDVAMPGLSGIEAARQIKSALPDTVVVLVSATHPDDLTREASSSRADEIVWKPELRPALLERIWQTHAPRDTAHPQR
jgi:DNA-binding NarL/FixJ family response regulator